MYFMKVSRRYEVKLETSDLTSPPALMDLTNPSYSIVVAMRQYHSYLLASGQARRLKLICRGRGALQWKRECTQLAKLLRRAILVCDSWCARRFVIYDEHHGPWIAAQYADRRVALTERIQMVPSHHKLCFVFDLINISSGGSDAKTEIISKIIISKVVISQIMISKIMMSKVMMS